MSWRIMRQNGMKTRGLLNGDRDEVPGDPPVVLRRSTRIQRPPDSLIWNI